MMKVLIVEDDKGIAEFLQLELEHEGYSTLLAADGRAALEVFECGKPDIVLLNLMLPKLNGLEVLRRIRKSANTPVIMLTARGDISDKVSGLDSGADDYLAKPFEIEELLARMRRNEARSTALLKLRGIELNPDSMEVTFNKNRLALSKTEYLMLKTLMEHKNTVLSRETIINAVWGEDHYIDENSVDVYVWYLRAKIDDPAGESYISTVRGAGYVMRDTTDTDNANE